MPLGFCTVDRSSVKTKDKGNDGQKEATSRHETIDAEHLLIFLFPELRPVVCSFHDRTTLFTRNNNNKNICRKSMSETGVLWKRRDVFKNRWRSRWFALRPSQGVLEYYLLTGDVVAQVTPRGSLHNTNGTASASNGNGNRGRTFSFESTVSNNSVDYDVVPRGTIYLLGCTVSVGPDGVGDGGLFSFIIESSCPPSDGTSVASTRIHLAARTAELRDRWVGKIDRVCRAGGSEASSLDENRTLMFSTPEMPMRIQHSGQRLTMQQHTIPEGEFEDASTDMYIDTMMNDNRSNSTLQDPWKSMGPKQQLYESVPNELSETIQRKMSQYLALCDESSDNSADWKVLSSRENGHAAYQNVTDKRIVKSVAVLPFPPKQVFNLVIDIQRRPSYETNVRRAERLQHINPYTFFDRYASFPVWPTAAREFVVCTHWEIVTRNNGERAIGMISFSCPESSAGVDPLPKHVRANLNCSVYLLRPVRQGDEECCHFARLLSLDLSGGVQQHLSNVIATQQTNLPGIIADYLQRNASVIENRFLGSLSNEIVVKSMVDRPKQRPRNFSRPPSPLAASDGDCTQSTTRTSSVQLPALASQALVLLAPVLLCTALSFYELPYRAALFFFCTFLAIRQIVLWHIGEPLSMPDDVCVVGPVTCRFSVDMKGILRFIANKREEREEQNTGVAEVSVVHIVASALSHAMVKESTMMRRRVKLPWLFIDAVVDGSASSLDVSISENSGGVVTLEDLDKKKIQSIADELVAAEESTTRTTKIGQCLLLSMPKYDDSDIVLDAAPIHPNVGVVAVVGGVHLEHGRKLSRGNGRKSSAPRPVLVLSLTITGQKQTDLFCCRRFASDVRKLLAFPEMCEV